MAMEMLATESAVSVPLDRQALAGIYEQYNQELFRYAYRLLGDPHLAEDCVSETFSRLLRTARDGRPIENVRAYLYRVVHNWAADHHRRQPLPQLELDSELHADPEGNPADQVHGLLENERVRAALLRLPSDQRQVIELRFLEEWPHDDVAAALGKTAEATRALQHRALAALRRMLLDPEAER